MKKIINGKKYDTATAKALYTMNSGALGDFEHVSETLYIKKTGEYFLYGEGGPMSRYARSAGQNCWSGGEAITPITEAKARAWAEKYMDGDEFESIFGEVDE